MHISGMMPAIKQAPGMLQGGAKNSENTLLTNRKVHDMKRMLANDKQEVFKDREQLQAANTVLCKSQSYGDTLRMQREKAKDTSLQVKKLKYQFKDISSKILRSKTSNAARQVASQAKREVLRLKRAKQSENYDSEEIDAAIAHAKAMERVAKKKVKHLEEEEMAKAAGGSCVDTVVEERDQDEKNVQGNEDELNQMESSSQQLTSDEQIDEESMQQVMQTQNPVNNFVSRFQDSLDAMFENTELSVEFSDDELAEMFSDFTEEMFAELEEGMRDMLEDMGLEDLVESASAARGDMDPADLKMMKIKHRNKEMKEIVQADAEYLKAYFDQLAKEKAAGSSAAIGGGASGGGTGGMSFGGGMGMSADAGVAASVSVSMPEASFDMSI